MTQALDIVHTEASCGWGGQEIRILSEAAGMIARGHRVRVLCPPQSRIFAEGPQRGVPTVALPIGRKNPRGLLALRGWLRAHPVDVINTHSSTDAWLAALACATLRDAPPIVRTRHISAAIPDNRATRWLYGRASRHIVTTGETLRRQLIEHNGFAARNITSIPTGIDTQRFAPTDAAGKAAARTALGLPADALLIGIVATLRSWKGHRYLLDAFARLARPNARLVVVGDGPQRAALEAQIGELGLAGRVVMPGNQADVLPWLHALDIFALPSYANEGVPQSLMQAMSCALPCLATDVGSTCELALDGRTALLIDKENAADLAAALERLLNDPALGRRLGEAARAHCVAGFGRAAMLDRMEAVFREALA